MDATTLRLWILAVGLVVIGAIYVWGKWQEGRTRRKQRVEPAVGSLVETEDRATAIPTLSQRYSAPLARPRSERPIDKPVPQPGRERPRPPPPPPPPAKELILTLSVLAPRGRMFNGVDLQAAFEKAGLVYGDMRIFHAPVDFERPDGPALFSITNILEPGTLEPERLKYLSTPGLIVFARLPAPVMGIEVFEHMQSTARFLAKELGGTLCDERRQPYTLEKSEEIAARIFSEIGNTIRTPEF